MNQTQYRLIEKPYVSVIVPVYNEESCIKDCIMSLLNQDFKPLEILAVDDGSIDDSVKICEQLKIRVLRQKHRGPGAARNLGAHNARGNILVLIDADMTFASDYVTNLVAPIIRDGALATCHWNEMVSNWDNPWARCQTWFSGRPDKRREPLTIPDNVHVYRAVRKDFFLESGGFIEGKGRGDDTSIARRTGVYSIIVPDAFCSHRNAAGPGEAFRDALWRGRNIAVSEEQRFKRCFNSVFFHNNPILGLLRGISLSIVKKEPRLVIYGAIHSLGISLGVIHGFTTGYYQK